MTIMDVAATAREDANAVLRTQYDGEPIVLVNAVPGAGKTRLVERLAVQAAGLLRERCMIVTQTNAQAFDLGRRFAQRWPRHQVIVFVTKEREPEALAQLSGLTNVRVTHEGHDATLRNPGIVIGNAHRWSYNNLATAGPLFDVQLTDEAYQLPDYLWVQIAGLARRWVLVGDPGQIDPVIDGDITRWADERDGPHVAAPLALMARRDRLARRTLRVTQRLSDETARYVGPAFYPRLNMIAASAAGVRRLQLVVCGMLSADVLLDRAADLGGIVMGELPPSTAEEVDEGVIEALVRLAERLIERGAQIEDEMGRRMLAPGDIGIVATHVSQVSALRASLPRALSNVRVDTANRWQGLEAEVTLVYHPLSGRNDVGAFHLDAGRLCVALTRHRIATLIVGRGGIQELLDRHVPLGDRVPGIDDDPEYEGWRAHRDLLRRLRADGRTLLLP